MNELEIQSNPSRIQAICPETIRKDFPILDQKIHRQRPLIYLDNGASTQHPASVIETMSRCYLETYANVHRGVHWLSEQTSAQFEQARQLVRQFLNARHDNEIIFTSGTTAGINLVARSWGETFLTAGDEILLSIFEHHSNMVPWHQVAQKTGAVVRFAEINDSGELDLDDFVSKLSSKTKIVSIAAVSNVLGTKVPVAELVNQARSVGAITVVDAAQHVPHEPTDVEKWNADFVVFSGHKMLGPTGIGVLWGKQEHLLVMPPFLGGGGMIDSVTLDGFTAGELPAKFEAGTPPIVEAIGLGAAIRYLMQFSMAAIADHERDLAHFAIEQIGSIKGLKILGPMSGDRAGIVSFVVEGISPQDIAMLLDSQGIAVRAGHHCAMPLHDHLGLRSSCRASFYLYNTREEVEVFARELQKTVERLR